jgi:hypothetical protein
MTGFTVKNTTIANVTIRRLPSFVSIKDDNSKGIGKGNAMIESIKNINAKCILLYFEKYLTTSVIYIIHYKIYFI